MPLTEDDPRVVVDGDGTFLFEWELPAGDAWFLVSLSNAGGESPFGAASDGPRDDPPSGWRCGGLP